MLQVTETSSTFRVVHTYSVPSWQVHILCSGESSEGGDERLPHHLQQQGERGGESPWSFFSTAPHRQTGTIIIKGLFAPLAKTVLGRWGRPTISSTRSLTSFMVLRIAKTILERIRKLRMSQAKKRKKTRTKTSMQLLKRKRQNWPKWGKRQPRGRDGSRCNDTWLDEENYNKNFKGCWEWSEELCFHQDHFGRAAQTYHRAYWQVLGVNNYGKLRQYKIHAMQKYDYQQTSFIKCEICCSKSFSANRLFGSLTANCCSESYLVKVANS